MPAARQDSRQPTLRAIKVAHTLVWAVFAGCIVALPFFAWRRDFPVAFTLMAVVGLEVLVPDPVGHDPGQDRRDRAEVPVRAAPVALRMAIRLGEQ